MVLEAVLLAPGFATDFDRFLVVDDGMVTSEEASLNIRYSVFLYKTSLQFYAEFLVSQYAMG